MPDIPVFRQKLWRPFLQFRAGTGVLRRGGSIQITGQVTGHVRTSFVLNETPKIRIGEPAVKLAVLVRDGAADKRIATADFIRSIVVMDETGDGFIDGFET